MISSLANPPGWLNLFDAACAAVATGAAVYVAVRDSRWRKTGLAKQLEDKIATAQQTADDWDRSASAVKLRNDVDQHSRKLSQHDDALRHVATHQDIAKLEGTVKALAETIDHAKGGVDRIEGILIKQALGGRGA